MACIKDLRERSPLRVLDRSIHGGLGKGNLGVVCAGAGAGKTAFLVGVGLDVLMRGCKVLHVALEQPVDRVRNYYDEIFAEIARSENLDRPSEARLLVERNRRIHAYQEHTFSPAAFDKALSFMRAHTDVHPDLIVVDGYDWAKGSEDEIRALKALAAGQEAELWMSAALDRTSPQADALPEPLARYDSLIDVLLRLKGADGTVHLTLLKDHGDPSPGAVALDLDPTTLLLVRR